MVLYGGGNGCGGYGDSGGEGGGSDGGADRTTHRNDSIAVNCQGIVTAMVVVVVVMTCNTAAQDNTRMHTQSTAHRNDSTAVNCQP